jgi:erythronate-4-phosphate dehydrogenase
MNYKYIGDFMKIVADENIPFVAKCFSSLGIVQALSGRAITPQITADADILLVRSITPVNEKLLAGSKVKFVATATIGYEHIDVDYLQKRKIGFASAPGSNANSVAEYVAAALLEMGQKHKISLENKSIGIIGVGNVGSKVATKCQALGMKVCLNDPPLQRQTGQNKYRPLDELFDCDIITLHTPLTLDGIDKTYHLADERFFKSLKSGCVFINTSRGDVVDGNALKSAIKSGRLKGVTLDVWPNEPNIDTDLLGLVDIGTPHIAGYSLDGKIAGMLMIYNSACEFFNIKPRYKIEDFLPEPDIKTLEIKQISGNSQDVISEVVRKIYPIEKDDSQLRQILNQPVENIGRYFDGLRKNYPVRREFQNTNIILRTQNSEHRTQNKEDFEPKTQNLKLKTILKGIGFKVPIK